MKEKNKGNEMTDQIADKLIDQCFQKHSSNTDKFVQCALKAGDKIKNIGEKSIRRSLFINMKLRECNLKNEEKCEEKAKEMAKKYQEETIRAFSKI